MDNRFVEDDGMRLVRSRRRFQTGLLIVLLLFFMDSRSPQPTETRRIGQETRLKNAKVLQDTVMKLAVDLEPVAHGEPFKVKDWSYYTGDWTRANRSSMWTDVPPMATQLPSSKDDIISPSGEDVIDVDVMSQKEGPQHLTFEMKTKAILTKTWAPCVSLVVGQMYLGSGVTEGNPVSTFEGLFFHNYGRLTAVSGVYPGSGAALKVVWDPPDDTISDENPADSNKNKYNRAHAPLDATGSGPASSVSPAGSPSNASDRLDGTARPASGSMENPTRDNDEEGGLDEGEHGGGNRRRLAGPGSYDEGKGVFDDGYKVPAGEHAWVLDRASSKNAKRSTQRSRVAEREEEAKEERMLKTVANLMEGPDKLEVRSAKNTFFRRWWDGGAKEDSSFNTRAASTSDGGFQKEPQKGQRILGTKGEKRSDGVAANSAGAAPKIPIKKEEAVLDYFPAMVEPAISVVGPGQVSGSLEWQDNKVAAAAAARYKPGCKFLLNLQAHTSDVVSGAEESSPKMADKMTGELVGINCGFSAIISVEASSLQQATSNVLSYTIVFAALCLLQMCILCCRVGILFAQQRYGRSFLVPRRFRPPKFDYHQPLPPEWGNAQASSETEAGQASAEEQDLETGLCPECAICYAAVGVESEDYMLTPCEHVFHQGCLTRWMGIKMECPTCRQTLPPALES